MDGVTPYFKWSMCFLVGVRTILSLFQTLSIARIRRSFVRGRLLPRSCTVNVCVFDHFDQQTLAWSTINIHAKHLGLFFNIAMVLLGCVCPLVCFHANVC